jgi:TRAP-type C4-dicarboxylate transport system permease small subunit
MSAEHETITYRGKRVVRAVGAILITVCALMAVLGTTVWAAELRGPMYALYWSWCFLMLVITMFVALVDLVMIRRVSRQTRRELFRQQFADKPRQD